MASRLVFYGKNKRKVYQGKRFMKNNLVELKHISKSFEDTMVLDDLCLEVKENEFITLLGPSGCGKTTTLRIIGGFEKPDKGRVIFDGKDITDVPANRRNLNTVFQKYALFQHMTIEENIAFGLKIKKNQKVISGIRSNMPCGWSIWTGMRNGSRLP